ncbi:MAG: hypothetical protein R3B58_03395 [Phycisphaerales bacterium]
MATGNSDHGRKPASSLKLSRLYSHRFRYIMTHEVFVPFVFASFDLTSTKPQICSNPKACPSSWDATAYPNASFSSEDTAWEEYNRSIQPGVDGHFTEHTDRLDVSFHNGGSVIYVITIEVRNCGLTKAKARHTTKGTTARHNNANSPT